MAAAMPYNLHQRCCFKHGRQRAVAEADGRTFDKYAVESPDDYVCFPDLEVRHASNILTAIALLQLMPPVKREWHEPSVPAVESCNAQSSAQHC